MDFAGIWQEHKVFITLVVAGLLVFIIGQAVISELYPVDSEKKALRKSLSSIRTLETVPRKVLAEAMDENDDLEKRYASVVERVNFAPRKGFLLNPSESADIQYFRIVSQEREALVEWPKTQNITVDESLGMPELSPTRKKDIQRSLLALDVVDRVVGLAIESNVGEVGSIEMVPDLARRRKGFVEELRVRFKMTGSLAAVASFLEKLQLEKNYLSIEAAEIEPVEGEGGRIAADFTVAALTVAKEEGE